jgi:hypothetical protein
MTLSRAQSDALKWLRDHGGDGCFDHNGIVLAGGETAPVMRATWNALRDLGLIEFYNPRPDRKGRGRIRIAHLQAAGA